MKYHRKNSGQAMVEVIIGLIGIIAITAGILQIAIIAKRHTEAMIKSRKEAGIYALMDIGTGNLSFNAQYITYWQCGPDKKRHTADDYPIIGYSGNFNSKIVEKAVRTPEQWQIIDALPDNKLSLLHDQISTEDYIGLVRGYVEFTIPLLPALQNLVYKKDSIKVKSETWMSSLTGLY